jgi:hypothetical protein
MKINSHGILFGCLLLPLLFTSCAENKNQGDCLSYQIAPITHVNGPDAGSINQDINFTLSFDIFNGCGQFGNIEHNSNANTTTVKINAKYQGCICTQIMGTLQTVYSFKATQAGTYYFKFFQSDGKYLLDTLTIK